MATFLALPREAGLLQHAIRVSGHGRRGTGAKPAECLLQRNFFHLRLGAFLNL